MHKINRMLSANQVAENREINNNAKERKEERNRKRRQTTRIPDDHSFN